MSGTCLPLHEVERLHIQKALDLFSGNRSETAKALGISRKTLYRKIKAYGLEQ
ncbi:helix-turn-helix domain-containing protein [Desulfosoma sp.]